MDAFPPNAATTSPIWATLNKKLVVVGTNPIPTGFPGREEIKPVALPFHFQGVRVFNPPDPEPSEK